MAVEKKTGIFDVATATDIVIDGEQYPLASVAKAFATRLKPNTKINYTVTDLDGVATVTFVGAAGFTTAASMMNKPLPAHQTQEGYNAKSAADYEAAVKAAAAKNPADPRCKRCMAINTCASRNPEVAKCVAQSMAMPKNAAGQPVMDAVPNPVAPPKVTLKKPSEKLKDELGVKPQIIHKTIPAVCMSCAVVDHCPSKVPVKGCAATITAALNQAAAEAGHPEEAIVLHAVCQECSEVEFCPTHDPKAGCAGKPITAPVIPVACKSCKFIESCDHDVKAGCGYEDARPGAPVVKKSTRKPKAEKVAEPVPDAKETASIEPPTVVPGAVSLKVHISMGSYCNFDLAVEGVDGNHARQLLMQEAELSVPLVRQIMLEAAKVAAELRY